MSNTNKNTGKKVFIPFDPKRECTPEELHTAEERLKVARMRLLMQYQFFGIMAISMPVSWSYEIPTACTDGFRIFWNPHFVNEVLTDSSAVFVYAHEIMHKIYEHFVRVGDRDKKLWNFATDFVINHTLHHDRIGKMPDWVLYDKRFADKTSEEVYEELLKADTSNMENFDVHVYIEGGGQPNGDGKKPTYIDADGGDGDDRDLDGIEEITDINGNKHKVRKATDEELKEMGNNIRDLIIRSAHASPPGSIPGDIRRMIEEFNRAKINWRDLLRNSIMSAEKRETSFARPDRKSWSNNFGGILPGPMPAETINVAIGIDNSGSISNAMLKDFLSEVRGIMEQFPTFRVHIWCFDTRVSGHVLFTEDEADDLINYNFTGGGGTAISVNWDYMQEGTELEDEFDADLFVCFTDLESGDLNEIDPGFIETVWVVAGSHHAAPFGRVAYYDDYPG